MNNDSEIVCLNGTEAFYLQTRIAAPAYVSQDFRFFLSERAWNGCFLAFHRRINGNCGVRYVEGPNLVILTLVPFNGSKLSVLSLKCFSMQSIESLGLV